MNIYDCKTVHEYYKCIKKHHKQYDFKMDLSDSNEINQIYNYLMSQLGRSSVLDFQFVNTYLSECKFYYNVKINYIRPVEFHIISKNKLSTVERTKLNHTISRICTILYLFKMSDKPYRFFIVMNPLKRFMPKSGEIITTENINGGFTYTNDRDIFIIRKEDYQKVIIHELLHHNNIIHNESWKLDNINKLKTVFKIHPKCIFIPNEAVVETFALMLHVCFTSIENNKRLKDIYDFEKTYSLEIRDKILELQNNKLWYEKSNAFCYTVIKDIMFSKFNRFLKVFSYRRYDDNAITNFLINNKQKNKNKNHKLMNHKKSLKLVYF